MKEKIQAIIFDLGGVILNIDYNRTSDAFKKIGVKDFDDMYSQKKANHLFKHLEKGKLTEEEFYNAFRRESNVHITNSQIENAWNSLILDFREEALKVMEAIRPKYKLFLLSNTNSIHLRWFNKQFEKQVGGLFEDYFDKVYYSHEMGLRKPDKEIYEYVLRENYLDPSKTLFIDDTPQNITTAGELGIQTLLLKEGMKIEDLEI